MEKKSLNIFFTNIWLIEDTKFYEDGNKAEYFEGDLDSKYVFWRKELDKGRFTFITDFDLAKRKLLEAKDMDIFNNLVYVFNVYKNNDKGKPSHSFEGTIYDALLYIKNQETKEWGGMRSDY